MASVPSRAPLPLFYQDLVPLNRQEHAAYRTRSTQVAKWLANQHAVPLTVEEFPLAQRHFPIVFSLGDDVVPLALMGLNEGVNVFVDDDGTVSEPLYMPAYARRYPFMLARLRPDADELSLCFDPTSELVGAFDAADGGQPLFDGEEPTDATKATLQFCEQFEIAGQKTQGFVADLKKHDLLISGELTIQADGQEQPFIYRGFGMVDENKLRQMRGDVLRGWAQNGMLPLIYAHLFSLDLSRELFARAQAQGKGPVLTVAPPELQPLT